MLGSLENPSAWVDYRLFAEQVFTQLHQRMANAIRQEHPGAIVGIDGAEQFSSYDGYDWWLLAKDLDLLNVYTRYFVPASYPNKLFNGQAVQSFGRQAKIKGGWLNGADLDYGGLFHTWYLALNGWNSVWWWRATMHPSIGPIQWNLQPNGVAKGMAKAAAEIKAGPGTMLAHAKKELDPIAVYYSSTNWHASTIESGIGYHINHLGLKEDMWWAPLHIPDPQQKQLWRGIVPKGHYASASKNFYLLLHDLGFQPRMMARQEIEAGALAGADIKVLVLPFVVALSDREAEEIRKFVMDSGMVIADYRCGMRDMHGKLRKAGVLDDLFGIERKNPDVVRDLKRVVYDANAAATQRGCQFNSVFHESIVAAGARAQGVHEDGSGAFFYRRHEGGGRTLYFNTDIYAYYEMRKRGLEEDLRETMRSVFGGLRDNTGPFVGAKFVPRYRGGHPVGQIEITRFGDGDTLYFGVLPDYAVDDKRPKKIYLPFPRHRHVYDVRARRYLGEGGMIPEVLEPGQPKMYVALRYKVTGVSAECPLEVQRGHQVDVQIGVSGSRKMVGPHAVRIEVALSDGTRPEYLSRTIYLPEGRGSYSLTPALNAPKGDWRIIVTECASGIQCIRKISVR